MICSKILIIRFIWMWFILPKFVLADVHVDEWDYDHHHTSPELWNGTCKTGRKQSPIDVNPVLTIKRRWGQPFVFNGYDQTISVLVKNNRHTLVVTPSNNDLNKDKVTVYGGGLGESKFQFAQAHFHWGSTNDQGSEHTLHNTSAPMEMHLVHWNLDLGNSLESAARKDVYNALEVLGVHFKIGKKNFEFESLFNAFEKVSVGNTNVTIEKDIILKDLLPENKFEYYRYQGSLTTPPCNEIVIWTIFKQPIEVSQKQIDIMRKAYYRVEGEKGHRDISNNYRAPQPLNGREVEEISTSIQFRSPILNTINARGSNGNQEQKCKLDIPQSIGVAWKSNMMKMSVPFIVLFSRYYIMAPWFHGL